MSSQNSRAVVLCLFSSFGKPHSEEQTTRSRKTNQESIIGYEMDTLCMDVSLLYQYATMISASKLVLHFAGPFLYSLLLWTGHISATCWCSRRLSWWIARLDDMPLLLIEPMCLHIIITYVMLIESMLITFRYILLLQQC